MARKSKTKTAPAAISKPSKLSPKDCMGIFHQAQLAFKAKNTHKTKELLYYFSQQYPYDKPLPNHHLIMAKFYYISSALHLSRAKALFLLPDKPTSAYSFRMQNYFLKKSFDGKIDDASTIILDKAIDGLEQAIEYYKDIDFNVFDQSERHQPVEVLINIYRELASANLCRNRALQAKVTSLNALFLQTLLHHQYPNAPDRSARRPTRAPACALRHVARQATCTATPSPASP